MSLGGGIFEDRIVGAPVPLAWRPSSDSDYNGETLAEDEVVCV
jgi:hypothetical protein